MPIWFAIFISLIFGAFFCFLWYECRQWEPQMYYDPKTKQIFKVIERRFGSMLCGSFCTFYSDAKAQTRCMPLSPKYLKGCRRITNVNECPDLEMDKTVSAWRVKGYK